MRDMSDEAWSRRRGKQEEEEDEEEKQYPTLSHWVILKKQVIQNNVQVDRKQQWNQCEAKNE